MSDQVEETVTITKKLYDELTANSLWLSDLEAAGIDNWEGIDVAFDMKREREAAPAGEPG